MIRFFFELFGWLPPLLQVVVFGVVAIFVFWSILKIIGLVMDIIPFL